MHLWRLNLHLEAKILLAKKRLEKVVTLCPMISAMRNSNAIGQKMVHLAFLTKSIREDFKIYKNKFCFSYQAIQLFREI